MESGNVGIGTTTPTQLLVIHDTSANPGLLINASDATNIAPQIDFSSDRPDDGNGAGKLRFFNQGSTPFVELRAHRGSSDTAGDFLIRTSDSERFRIDEDGNVGIGTTNPAQKLTVEGDVNISSNLTVDTNTLFVDAENNRVGIGTTSPKGVFDMYKSDLMMRTSTYYNYSSIADPNSAAVVTPIFNVLHHDSSMATYKIDILLYMGGSYGNSASYVVGTISKEGQATSECASGLRQGSYTTTTDVVSTSGNGYLDITPTFAWVEDSHNCNATVLNFTMSSLDMVSTVPLYIWTKVTVTSRDSGNAWPELNWTSIHLG
jgi:hypothetical protein